MKRYDPYLNRRVNEPGMFATAWMFLRLHGCWKEAFGGVSVLLVGWTLLTTLAAAV